eukprot:1160827-Pelagomonas_calceolata.AAC.22
MSAFAPSHPQTHCARAPLLGEELAALARTLRQGTGLVRSQGSAAPQSPSWQWPPANITQPHSPRRNGSHSSAWMTVFCCTLPVQCTGSCSAASGKTGCRQPTTKQTIAGALATCLQPWLGRCAFGPPLLQPYNPWKQCITKQATACAPATCLQPWLGRCVFGLPSLQPSNHPAPAAIAQPASKQAKKGKAPQFNLICKCWHFSPASACCYWPMHQPQKHTMVENLNREGEFQNGWVLSPQADANSDTMQEVNFGCQPHPCRIS